MALDFPSSPTNDQIYTSGGKSWIYNTTTGAWKTYVEQDYENIGFFAESYTANLIMSTFPVGRQYTILTDFSGTAFHASTNATSNVIITVQKIESGSVANVGTITLHANGNFTPSTQSANTVATGVGNAIRFLAPSSVDSTLANFSLTIRIRES